MNEISMNTKFKPWKYAVRMTKAYVESNIEKIKNVYPFQDGIPTFRIGDMTSAYGHKVTNDIYAYGRHYHEDKMPGGNVDNYISSQIVYEYFANIVADDSPVLWSPCDGSVDIHFDAEGVYTKSYAIEVPFEAGGKETTSPVGYNVWCTKEEEMWAFEKIVGPSAYYDEYKERDMKHPNISFESYFEEFLKQDEAIQAEADKEIYDEWEYERTMP